MQEILASNTEDTDMLKDTINPVIQEETIASDPVEKVYTDMPVQPYLTEEQINELTSDTLKRLQDGEIIKNPTLYQILAIRTAFFRSPYNIADLSYCTMGLAGEAGEVANKIKKALRGDYGEQIPVEKIREIGDEIGDVLWYATSICTILNLDLSEIMTKNIIKLHERHLNNTIQGDGDNR
jgi:NTP pyrophosphatase (non-canonical NTP hydrolase)